jgi:hypothetical protein
MLVGVLTLAGIVVTADALVTTPKEQVERFLDEVSAPRVDQRVDAALSYANPSHVPCRLNADGDVSSFDEGEASRLGEALRSALSVFDSEQQALLQKSIEVADDKATITTRIGDNEYEQTVIYHLVRDDERWLLRTVRVL